MNRAGPRANDKGATKSSCKTMREAFSWLVPVCVGILNTMQSKDSNIKKCSKGSGLGIGVTN